MANLFISHVHDDRAFAEALRFALESLGDSAAYDDIVLQPGDRWQTVLDTAIKEADALVAIISESSTESRWAATELESALSYSIESGRMTVIPVVLGDIPIPQIVSNLKVIRTSGDNVSEVADTISRAAAAFTGRRMAREEDRKETAERIEVNSSEYVDEAMKSQKSAETRYRWIGMAWYSLGLVALIAGLVFAERALTGADEPYTDWIRFAYTTVRSIIAVVLLGACARYTFTLGRSFMIESLKCSDRIHAISFGKFYLRIFGERAKWSEMQEAFANWNIDRASAFVETKASEFDPKILEKLVTLVKVARGDVEANASGKASDTR